MTHTVPPITGEFNAVAYVARDGKLTPIAASWDVTDLWNQRVSPLDNEQVRAFISRYGSSYIYDVLTDLRGGPGQYTAWRSSSVPTLEDAMDELTFLCRDNWRVLREGVVQANGSRHLLPNVVNDLNAWVQQRATERHAAENKPVRVADPSVSFDEYVKSLNHPDAPNYEFVALGGVNDLPGAVQIVAVEDDTRGNVTGLVLRDWEIGSRAVKELNGATVIFGPVGEMGEVLVKVPAASLPANVVFATEELCTMAHGFQQADEQLLSYAR